MQAFSGVNYSMPSPAAQNTTTTTWHSSIRRVRRWLARQNLKDLLGTLALVVFLTVLIWVWAEREQIVGEKRMPPFALVLESDTQDRVITAIRSQSTAGTVMAVESKFSDRISVNELFVSGPNLRADDLSRALRIDPKILLSVSRDLEIGRETRIDLAARLSELPELADRGLSIKRIEPQFFEFRVDKLESRTVQIIPPPQLSGDFQITFVPDTVTVRGPSRELDELESAGALKVIAKLTQQQLAPLSQAGKTLLELEDVGLSAPGSRLQIVNDLTCRAIIRPPETRNETRTLNAVPFYVMTHSALVQRRSTVAVSINDRPVTTTLPNIEIEGPTALLDRVTRGELGFVIKAFLQLDAADTALQGVERPVEYITPPGVSVVTRDRKVKVTVNTPAS